MKILLIDPPYERLMGLKSSLVYPIGLGYLTSLLNNKGYNTFYLNLDYDDSLPSANPFSRQFNVDSFKKYLANLDDRNHPVWEETAVFISNFKPDVVGITAITVKMPSVIRLAKLVKECCPDTMVVLGGHHPQLFPKEILANVGAVDLIVKGEGELTFLQLMETRRNTVDTATFFSHQTLSHIPGIFYRDDQGVLRETEDRPQIKNLDDLPYPDSASFIMNTLGPQVMQLNALIASRGCPFNCKYCATNNMWKRKVRFRSVENVTDEIKERIHQQGDYYYYFFDDCFTLNRDWLNEFTDTIINNKIKFNYSCITSSRLLDGNLFRKIIESGCNKINIAIESGSERILQHCNKGTDLSNIRTIFGYAKKYNISTTAYIMLGFPTETEEDIKKTQAIISELQPNWVYANVLIPLPGTEYFQWAVENQMISMEKAWSGECYPHLQKNYTGAISDERFNELVDETYRLCFNINSSWRNLWKRLPIRHYLKNPGKFLSDSKKTINWMKQK